MEINPLVYQFIFHFITLITLITQAYLFYLINTKCPKSMQTYKYFLNTFTFWDLMYTISIGLLVIPDPIGRLFASRIWGLSSLISPEAQILSSPCSIALYSGSGMLLCQHYCLLYRFTVILENQIYHQLLISNWSKLFFAIGGQLFMIVIGILTYYTCLSQEILQNYLSLQLSDIWEYFKPGEFVILMDLDSKYVQFVMLTILILFLLSQLFCFLLVFIILQILRKKVAKFSKNTLRLHLQFTLLLASQLIVPFAIIMLPVGICLIKTLQGNILPKFYLQLGFIFISNYGLINTVLTLVFIGPFKKHFLQHVLAPILSLVGLMSLVPNESEVSMNIRSSRVYSKNMANVK